MGRNYDEHGTRDDWWSSSVAKEFKRRAQCLIGQYSHLPVVMDGYNLGNTNGELTLSENIADNEGIRLAHAAYQSCKSRLETQEDDDTFFFLSFVQSWCEKTSSEYAELLREKNQHAMDQWRVNVPLINYDKFAPAPAGSRMSPTSKCVVWG